MKILIIALAIIVTVVPSRQRDNPGDMVFLVDKSGSMSSDEVGMAIDMFARIAMAADPSLDVTICVYQFASYPIKWAHGWKKLPSRDHLDWAQDFLNSGPAEHYKYASCTNVIPAIAAAMQEHKKKMSIVIISDGMFGEDEENIVDEIKKWQKWRVLNGRWIAAVGCMGVGPVRSQAMKRIAQLGESIGYYHLEEEEEEDEDD